MCRQPSALASDLWPVFYHIWRHGVILQRASIFSAISPVIDVAQAVHCGVSCTSWLHAGDNAAGCHRAAHSRSMEEVRAGA
jgi:hypothetical protein